MVQFNAQNLYARAIGSDHGISESDIGQLHERIAGIHRWLQKSKEENTLPFLNLPWQDDVTKACEDAAAKVRAEFDDFVILGIGGSALGPSALQQALNDNFHNLKPKDKRKGPRLFIADNSDPRYFQEILDTIDLEKTCFNVITKSGSTAETMSQLLVVVDLLKKRFGENWKKHIVLTTDPKGGALRKIANLEGNMTTLPIDPGVGGRFSIFTPVGLFPAAVMGIDIRAMLRGVARAVEKAQTTDLAINNSYHFAVSCYLADTKRGKKIVVMMPYANALYGVSDWFCQLWAESLGKRKDLDGKDVFTGQTPVKALGATDQHSQVQLYVEGPNDKMTVFIDTPDYGADIAIPNAFPHESSLAYLVGKGFKELIITEKEGTEHALTANHRPNATFSLSGINPEEIGELFMTFEIATAFAGKLYNINAFDQPGVEWGKEYVYRKFGKEGY